MASPSPASLEAGPRTAFPAATGTQTQTSTEPLIVPPSVRAPDGTLQLRGGPISNRRVQWNEDVVDNEGLGRKSSKVCCIYHRPRAYDESSSSDDSSSDSDSDSDREGKGGSGDGDGKDGHEHGDGCDHGHGAGKKRQSRKPKPNAYEKMPKPRR